MNKHLILRSVFSFLLILMWIIPDTAVAQQLTKKWFPGHYVSIRHNNREVQTGIRNLVKDNPYITGYKVMALWSEIETSKDNYDFSVIQNFIDIAEADGKKLFIFLQDRAYTGKREVPFLPQYILTAEYEGGWYYAESHNASYSKVFLPQYQERWNKYLSALGAFMDDNLTIAVITNQESATPGFKDCPNYTLDGYIKYIKSMGTTMANSFPKTIFCQYVNWMFPETAREEIMKHQVEVCKNGFGGPDLNDGGGTWTLNMQFGPYYTQYRGIAPICVENQSSGYKTETAEIILNYAVDQVGDHFLSWAPYTATDRAYNFNDALNEITKQKGRINTAPPSNIISTGVSSNQTLSGKYSIYPNPVNDMVKLSLNYDYPDGSHTCQLLDISGKVLDTKVISNPSSIISTSQLVKGTYFLRITDNYLNTETLKFIKI